MAQQVHAVIELKITPQRDCGFGKIAERVAPHVVGMHLNDVKDFDDDHRQPGWGKVDFAALKKIAQGDVLRVFEPHKPVTAEELKVSLDLIRSLWREDG